jgi:hypothetical protein
MALIVPGIAKRILLVRNNHRDANNRLLADVFFFAADGKVERLSHAKRPSSCMRRFNTTQQEFFDANQLSGSRH